jgi:hypothetical protein
MADLALELMAVGAGAGDDRRTLCRRVTLPQQRREVAREVGGVVDTGVLCPVDRGRPVRNAQGCATCFGGLWGSVTNRCGVFLSPAR